jgi:hydrogenase maturation protein HypF
VTTASATPRAREAWRVVVRGIVQGVGFRPFVHRLARREGLAGYVRNIASDVEILIEGDLERLAAFVRALTIDAPPLARVDHVETSAVAESGRVGFEVMASRLRSIVRPLISPDVAPCAECERELYEPSNRRSGYAFITCTDCGPRQSVIDDLPYDRERTSMRAFSQCPACAREYADIGDRRYRSETNSCPHCGPSLALLGPTGERLPLGDPIAGATAVLLEGGIVAVRGVGGFHLAADATNETAVARLRQRKRRDGKPLAIMVRRLADARALASVSEREATCLSSPQRPIVILERHDGAPLAPSVSDGLRSVGVMLPCSPLHMLLLDAVARPLVMTSGNPTNVPLAFALDEALATLGDVADAFLTHDREIVVPVDDSVMRVVDDERVMMRRARGFAPLPISLPIAPPAPVLAVGAHLKNTFTLVDGTDAFVSQHIGDLETLETVQHWERTLESFTRMLGIHPRAGARDLHPDYASSRLANQRYGDDVVVVQHHHAHIAAVAAEHGVTEPVIGVAFDGTGLGTDGAIWGAEFMVADLRSFRRVGRLRYAPLPGGDRAAREGWRAALGYAHVVGANGELIVQALRALDAGATRLVMQQCRAGVNAPPASSMGRLFDAAAAIIGVCDVSRYEGEAAMRLESMAAHIAADPIALPMSESEPWILDPAPMLAELARRSLAGEDPAYLAAAFHESVAESAVTVVLRIAERDRLDRVALGGGVFQNARLLSSLRTRLTRAGLQVLTGVQLSPNDGSISYGQAAVAAGQLGA